MRGPKRVTGALTWGRVRQGGVLSGSFWLPAVKKRQHRPGRRAVRAGQKPVVKRLAGVKALQAPPGLSLLIHAQQITGVVPQLIGCDPDRPLHRGGQGHGPGDQYSLFSPFLLPFEGDDLFQFPGVVDVQRVGDPGPAPPGAVQHALGGQVLIVPYQRL